MGEVRFRTGLGALAVVVIGAYAVLPRVIQAQGAPPPPINLVSTVQGNTVALSWQPGPTTVGPVLYQLEVGTSSGASNLLVSHVATPGVTAPGVPDGVYYARVRAGSQFGLSAASNEVVVRVGCNGPPTLPVGVSVQVAGNVVAIGWPHVAGAIGYQLEVGSRIGASDLGVFPLVNPGIVVSGVPAGVYYVRARALNNCGWSSPSGDSPVYVGVSQPSPTPTPNPGPTPAPPQIGSFHASPSTLTVGQSVTFTWSGITGNPTPALSMNQGIGPVTGTSRTIVPPSPGVFVVTLTATNSLGSASKSWTITVNPTTSPTPTLVAPQIGSFQASPSTVTVGQPVTFTWSGITGNPPPSLSMNLGIGAVTGTSKVIVPSTPGVFVATLTATNSAGSASRSRTVTVNAATTTPTPNPTPGTNPIFGAVDPAILGTCTAAQHDAWTIDGGDGYRYRTWHPQQDPSGCVYAHEHGDNPASIQNAEIASVPVKFGYIGRRHPMPDEPNGHDEAHEGFKVFIANPGDRNDEFRVNRVYSRSVFHMGTGGPKRFVMQHHSAEIRVVHPEFGLKAFTQLMMDTGGTATVCDPRKATPTKDVVQLNSPCMLTSAYEIWGTTQAVRSGGREVYRSFATPAVFDPITVKNPANILELVYAWDPRMAASKIHNTDWRQHRGCERESYAQPGYWNNSRGPTTYYTDPMGNEVPASHPQALAQYISQHQSVGAPATDDGMHQFKMRRNYCGQLSRLGLKN